MGMGREAHDLLINSQEAPWSRLIYHISYGIGWLVGRRLGALCTNIWGPNVNSVLPSDTAPPLTLPDKFSIFTTQQVPIILQKPHPCLPTVDVPRRTCRSVSSATDLRRVFSADQVPGILVAYMRGLKMAFAIGFASTGVAFIIITLFQRWNRLKPAAIAGGAGAERAQ